MRRVIMSTFVLTCAIPLAACGSSGTDTAKTSATTTSFTSTSASAPTTSTSSSTHTTQTSTSSSTSRSTPASPSASTSTTTVHAPSTITPAAKASSSTPPNTTKSTPRTTAVPATKSAAPIASNATLGLPGWGTGVPNQEGFGQARPGTIFNGGDPTGMVTDVKWDSWGGKIATGSGVAEYVGPNESVAGGHQEPVKVVAFNLTTCGGLPAYRYVNWYFPAHGGTLQKAMTGNGEGYDLCNDN